MQSRNNGRVEFSFSYQGVAEPTGTRLSPKEQIEHCAYQDYFACAEYRFNALASASANADFPASGQGTVDRPCILGRHSRPWLWTRPGRCIRQADQRSGGLARRQSWHRARRGCALQMPYVVIIAPAERKLQTALALKGRTSRPVQFGRLMRLCYSNEICRALLRRESRS
jgi:hypothetical protein